MSDTSACQRCSDGQHPVGAWNEPKTPQWTRLCAVCKVAVTLLLEQGRDPADVSYNATLMETPAAMQLAAKVHGGTGTEPAFNYAAKIQTAQDLGGRAAAKRACRDVAAEICACYRGREACSMAVDVYAVLRRDDGSLMSLCYDFANALRENAASTKAALLSERCRQGRHDLCGHTADECACACHRQ